MPKHPVRNGVRNKTTRATALARRYRKTMSFSEEKLWENLRDHRIGYSFRRNHPMLTWWLDFYCPAAKLNVEVDGEQHDLAKERDLRRDNELADEGILTLRFPSLKVLGEMREVLNEVTRVCQERTGKPPKYKRE